MYYPPSSSYYSPSLYGYNPTVTCAPGVLLTYRAYSHVRSVLIELPRHADSKEGVLHCVGDASEDGGGSLETVL